MSSATCAAMRCILVDDIVDSGGTLCNAADALLEAGAVSVTPMSPTACSRPVRSPGSRPAARAAGDHRQHPAERGCARDPKIRVLSVAQLMGEAISRISSESSVSSLFD